MWAISYGSSTIAFVSIASGSFDIQVLDMFGDVVVLKLHGNKLITFCLEGIRTIPSLKSLDISSNCITYDSQPHHCFKPFQGMIMVNLSYNHISLLPEKLFTQNNQVELLDLSFNSIISLQDSSLRRLNILKVFLFKQDHNIMIGRNTFAFSNLELVVTRDLHLCCFVSHGTHCTSKISWPFKCGDLLGSMSIRVCLWILSLLIALFNGASITVCSYKIYKHRPLSDMSISCTITILMLNIGDFLNGLHLIIIASADIYFGSDYVGQDVYWRRSILCNFSSMVSLFANLITMYSLCLIAACQLSVTLNPLKSNAIRTDFVLKLILLGVCCNVLATIISVSLGFKGVMIQPTPLCIVYGVNTKIYSSVALIFGLSQMLATAIIVVIYSYLILSLREICKNQRKLDASEKGERMANFKVVIQLILVSISNVVCWMPSSILMLSSVISDTYPITLLFWVVLVLTPLNSILNPCLLQSNVKLRCLKSGLPRSMPNADQCRSIPTKIHALIRNVHQCRSSECTGEGDCPDQSTTGVTSNPR